MQNPSPEPAPRADAHDDAGTSTRWTPLPRPRFAHEEAHRDASRAAPHPARPHTSRPHAGRRTAAACAALSLSAAAVLPVLPVGAVLGAGVAGGTALASRSASADAQLLTGAVAAAPLDAVGEVSAVEVPPPPAATAPAASGIPSWLRGPQAGSGVVDFTTLAPTTLRYPFDQEMPLTDGFGYRTAPVAQFHDAQDIAAPNGTPIRVVGDGVVVEAGWSSDGCGFALQVQHNVGGADVTSRYCHMQSDSHAYQVGDAVRAGDPAGLVGNTGMSFGAHLHLLLRRDGEPVDPLPYIAAAAAALGASDG